MLDYKEERKDVEEFINSTVKKLTSEDKQRVADILFGAAIVLTAEPPTQLIAFPIASWKM